MAVHNHSPREGPTDLEIIKQELRLVALRLDRLENRLAEAVEPERSVREGQGQGQGNAISSAIHTTKHIVPWETREIMLIRQMSERQRQAFALAMDGYSNAEIGEKLGVQEGSVKSFLRVVFEKIGVHSRAALMDRYLEPWLHNLSERMREAIVAGQPADRLAEIAQEERGRSAAL